MLLTVQSKLLALSDWGAQGTRASGSLICQWMGRALKWPRGLMWSRKHACNYSAVDSLARRHAICISYGFLLHCLCFLALFCIVHVFVMGLLDFLLRTFSKMNESYRKHQKKISCSIYWWHLLLLSGTCDNLTCVFLTCTLFLFHCPTSCIFLISEAHAPIWGICSSVF